MRNAVVLLFSVGLVSACSGPMGPIPGGALEGTPAPWPEDWSYTDEIENVLLQTRPEDPYSVTIWIAFANGNAYIVAGDSESNWVQNIRANPSVILSVDGQLINAIVSDVTANEELNTGVQAFLEKYEMDEEDFVREEGLMFRLNKP